jgi:glucose/arabinose dehydrogenase
MLSSDPNRADPGSEREIFRTPPKPSWNHNGGTIVFGPDGYLYLALGDGGPVKDPNGNGQYLQTVFGKILRIAVHREAPELKYAIAKANPFVNVAGACGEIWATGLFGG